MDNYNEIKNELLDNEIRYKRISTKSIDKNTNTRDIEIEWNFEF